MIEQVLTFTEWKRELAALLENMQVRALLQGVWRKFHAIGYAPADAAEFEKECSEISAILRGDDNDY